MSRRTDRVEVQLQREIAGILLRGELRDPRLSRIESLSITGTRVSADLSSARIFFDVVADETEAAAITEALNAGTARVRSLLAGRLDMRRVPALRFERDAAIERGVRMEALFADMERERRAAARAEAAAAERESSNDPASEAETEADPAPDVSGDKSGETDEP
jgi:ribosome-binding factor A